MNILGTVKVVEVYKKIQESSKIEVVWTLKKKKKWRRLQEKIPKKVYKNLDS